VPERPAFRTTHFFMLSDSRVAIIASSIRPSHGCRPLLTRFQHAALAVCATLGLRPAVASLGAQAPTRSAYTDTVGAVRIDTLLDLPSVIARALAASPAASQGEEGVRTARSEVRVARGAYMPSLTATSSALRSDIVSSPIGINAGNSYAAGLLSSVDLYTGGRRGADRVRSEADLTAAEAVNISQRYLVTLLAERGFYEALRDIHRLGVAQARVTRAEQSLRYSTDRVRAGTATRSDELRARLELTTGRQQLIAARDTLQSAAYSLGRLVGANGPIGAMRPASLDPRPLSMGDSEIVRLAIATAPTVQAAAATARASEAGTRSAKALYYPDLRLTGGYALANESPLIGATRPGWQFAIGTSFPIFNGFLREDAVTRSEAVAEVARVNSLDATRLVRTESARLLSGLRVAEQSIALANEAVVAAREDLRVQTERYRAGIATSLDRLTSELAVTQAELALVAARYNYQVTRATLEALVGRAL
jgi:outer membrane protein